MSDDVRARIAQILYGDGDRESWASAVQQADLVMWALGLHREEVGSGAACVILGMPEATGASRYVTDWVPEGGQESGDDGQA